jgi:hypothetical protein
MTSFANYRNLARRAQSSRDEAGELAMLLKALTFDTSECSADTLADVHARIKRLNPCSATYVEMTCIGDHADFVVYYDERIATLVERGPSACSWMVPGSWEGRDAFGRKTAITGYPQEA